MAFCEYIIHPSCPDRHESDINTTFLSSRNSWNHGQACCAGTRIFVHEKIYDEFLKLFTEKAKSIKIGNPFAKDSYQGPQVSQIQYDVSQRLRA